MLEGAADEAVGAAVNTDDAMQLCSTAELTELFSEYYQADIEDPDYLVNDETSLNADIDFAPAALTHPSVAPAVPVITRAVIGNNDEELSLQDMISAD